MKRLLVLSLALLAVTAIVSPVQAEKVDLNDKELADVATHIINGRVKAIYRSEEKQGDWAYTNYVAEIDVEGCDKGNLKPKVAPLYARYWTREWIGKGQVPPSTNGHRGLPAVGDHVRAYLAKNAYDGFSNENHDGGFNVIGANGFVRLRGHNHSEKEAPAK